MKIYKITKIDEKEQTVINNVFATSKRQIPIEAKENAVLITDITPSIKELEKAINKSNLNVLYKKLFIEALKHSDNKRRS